MVVATENGTDKDQDEETRNEVPAPLRPPASVADEAEVKKGCHTRGKNILLSITYNGHISMSTDS